MNAGASLSAVPSPIEGSGTAWVLLGSWALSPARPTPIPPRHECRGFSALLVKNALCKRWDTPEKNDAHLMALAKQVWTLRWALLKKPTNLSLEEKQTIAELEREDEGFVQRFRRIIRPLVNIFDHAHSEAQAKIKLKQLRQEINAVDDAHLQKILTFFDDHWEQALRYLRNKGMGKHRRGSNSESGRRLLRRLEKNHDGIRSVGTRQHYMQIYQAIQYLSVDIAEFREQGPQMTGPPRV